MTNNSDPTCMYYDLDIVNTDFSEFGQPPQRLTFTEVRSSAILSNPQDYFMSIVRFSLDTAGSMPLMIPQIDLKQSNQPWLNPPINTIPNPYFTADFPNLTSYQITMTYYDPTNAASLAYGPWTVSRPILYRPHFTSAVKLPNLMPPATAPLTLESVTTPYYWIQSWEWWVSLINETLDIIWNEYIALGGTALPPPAVGNYPAGPITLAPYMEWDTTTNYATMVYPAQYTTGTAPTTITSWGFTQSAFWNPYEVPQSSTQPTVKMAFNSALHTLFSSFEYVFNNWENPNYENYILRVYAKNGSDNYYPFGSENKSVGAGIPGGPLQPATQTTQIIANGLITNCPPFDAIKMRQIYGTGATMCPISSLIFETSLMPIVPQMIGLPKVFTNPLAFGTQVITGGQNNNISNEITDIVEPLNRGDEYFPNVLYLPQAEYRLIDLQGNGAISSIQISVKWKDVYGIYHDFYLFNGCGASMKILFRKKAYNNISAS